MQHMFNWATFVKELLSRVQHVTLAIFSLILLLIMLLFPKAKWALISIYIILFTEEIKIATIKKETDLVHFSLIYATNYYNIT